MIFNRVFESLSYRIDLYTYRRTIPSKVKSMRNKPKIKVLFIVSELSIWKTESLYREMLRHQRFEPILGVALLTADKPSEVIRKYEILTKYLSDKNYTYIELFGSCIGSKINPDIIFYQQPYDGFISHDLFFRNNKGSLFCNVNYGFNSLDQKWIGELAYFHYCWQFYYENMTSMSCYESLMPSSTRGKGRITGLPFQDLLEKDKNQFIDPWNLQTKNKKRIIWAPHHSIPTGRNLIEYSTFLTIADEMIRIAQEFKENIQIAFKPHPFLLKKLYDIWGKDRTDAYYQKWDQMENTQLELGEYYGLFKHSDAMIHDCCSFTIEYLYMNNPVMYLSNGKPHIVTLNDFGKNAYNAHVIGQSKEDIVQFVQDVINGEDVLKGYREKFFKEYLTIPYSGNASLNIINSILNG